MEDLDDFIIPNNNIFLNNNQYLHSIDASNSDPIPSLFIPSKIITKKSKTSIQYIISDIKKKNKNLNSIQMKRLFSEKISILIPNYNLQKHNSTPNKKNVMLINDLMESKETHFIATFKEYLISDFHEEFLRRYFVFNEIKEILPKFYQYYKNYLNFFCKGTFSDFNLNEIMQEYGECQAEFYYNKNYGHKDRMKKKEKKGLDDINKEEESEEFDSNNKNDNIRSIFSNSIKYSIEKISMSYGYKNDNNNKDLSNIKPCNYSKDNTISLPDNSSVSYNDIITKQNSIRYIINLIDDKKELTKRIKNKKREIISNKKKPNNNGHIENYINMLNNDSKKLSNYYSNIKNSINKNIESTLSKTNSNQNMKISKNEKLKKRTKSSNIKVNHLTKHINYKIKNNPSMTNYKKYIDFLCNKQRNKSNEQKIKLSQDEFTFSMHKLNKNIKQKNIISPLNPNDIISHFNLFSENNFNSNKKNTTKKNNNNINNKVNPSFLLINNLFNKTSRNSNKYNTLFPSSNSRNNSNKIKFNINEKNQDINKGKKKSKNKEKSNNKFLSFNPNISIKSVKNLSPSGKYTNIINNNNYNTNNVNNSKPLSYSTVNNCNININNNIILSNNYFNGKNHHQLNQHPINLLSQKNIDKNIKQKRKYSLTKFVNSRNNKNDLNRFKTEVNILNSLLCQDKEKINKNSNISNNNCYKSFRKSNNNDILNKMKNMENIKNNNNHNRNLSLKNIPITVKNNMNNNFSMSKIGKIHDEYEFNSTYKTYKHFCLKKNNNSKQQNKIIFDYKRK
jgi:hypothetical protein